jgi:hypothetical protein
MSGKTFVGAAGCSADIFFGSEFFCKKEYTSARMIPKN